MRLCRYDKTKPHGELAQLVECCDRTAEARGSNPLFSIRKAYSYFCHARRSSRNSDAGSVLVTSRRSRARVQAT